MSSTIAITLGGSRQTMLTATERRELNRLLNRWGNWMEQHGDYQGYPSVNILEAARGGRGGVPGHRILCLEMPDDVYHTHQRVLRLPKHEQQAVWLWYVPVMLENGTVRTISDRCETAGIKEEALRKRVYRARLRIAGISLRQSDF